MDTRIKSESLGTAVKSTLALTLTIFACATSRAQFTTIAYDGFNYGTGSLSGKNGGTGWTSSWTNDYKSGASLQLSLTPMTYTGLTTTGGSVVWGSGGNGISEDTRTLPLMDSGVVYLQFLSKFGSTSGGGTPNIRLLNSGTITGGIGGNGGTHGGVMSILGASLNPVANGSSSTTASLSSQNLVVARIDYQDHSMSLWVNPNLSTFDYENPTTPNATYAGLAPAFNTIAIFSRSPASLDEFTVIAEPVPEPTTLTLMMGGIGSAVLYARRRQKRAAGILPADH